MASPTQWTWFKQAPGDVEGQGGWSVAVHRVAKTWTLLVTEQQ